MGSDVDVVVLTDQPQRYEAPASWFEAARPNARLVRTASWGPVREQRYRLRSGGGSVAQLATRRREIAVGGE